MAKTKEQELRERLGEVENLLKVCLLIFNSTPTGYEVHRSAWRLADAGALLREALENYGVDGTTAGLDRPTGRGATLPRSAS